MHCGVEMGNIAGQKSSIRTKHFGTLFNKNCQNDKRNNNFEYISFCLGRIREEILPNTLKKHNVHSRNSETKRATWRLNDISEVSENASQGSIRAKFALQNGKSTPSTTALQFIAEGSTFSGLDFDLAGPGYRISLSKKRCGAGKFAMVQTCLTKLV